MFSDRPSLQGHQDLRLRSEALTAEKERLPLFLKSQCVEASRDTSVGHVQRFWPSACPAGGPHLHPVVCWGRSIFQKKMEIGVGVCLAKKGKGPGKIKEYILVTGHKTDCRISKDKF